MLCLARRTWLKTPTDRQNEREMGYYHIYGQTDPMWRQRRVWSRRDVNPGQQIPNVLVSSTVGPYECMCMRACACERQKINWLYHCSWWKQKDEQKSVSGCKKAEEADKKMKSQKFFMSIIRIPNNDPEPGIEPPPSYPANDTCHTHGDAIF